MPVSIPIEPDGRIRLPAEWLDALGLRGRVALERVADGILVRPCPPTTWDDIFATKLTIGSAPPGDPDALELTGDDFLF
jgi:bifunctional DNA-binding transcriptional regulator/antitoxin component of YhaV-PrlF toxin-antitoxin module